MEIMKRLLILFLALSAGCSTTNHLSSALALNQKANNRQRVRYVARLQTALLEYVACTTPDFENGSYLEQASLKWIRIGTNGWLAVASRSHHADHFYLRERDWFGAVSVAIDSDGFFYYSLGDICGSPDYRGQHYSTVLDFLKKNLYWDWHPLPPPRQATSATTLPTEHELRAMADQYRERLENKVVDISNLKVFSDGSVSIDATPRNGDLTPFVGIPIEYLSLTTEDITDLSTLQRLNLQVLKLYSYKGSDISSLSQTKIRELHLVCCNNIDFSTLRDIKTLQKLLWYPINENPSFELLRNVDNLQSIQGKSPTVFWREWDNGAYRKVDEPENTGYENIEII